MYLRVCKCGEHASAVYPHLHVAGSFARLYLRVCKCGEHASAVYPHLHVAGSFARLRVVFYL